MAIAFEQPFIRSCYTRA